MKGLWIQIILITVCWSFAIISITMVDRILKYLYALFNILQVSSSSTLGHFVTIHSIW